MLCTKMTLYDGFVVRCKHLSKCSLSFFCRCSSMISVWAVSTFINIMLNNLKLVTVVPRLLGALKITHNRWNTCYRIMDFFRCKTPQYAHFYLTDVKIFFFLSLFTIKVLTFARKIHPVRGGATGEQRGAICPASKKLCPPKISVNVAK